MYTSLRALATATALFTTPLLFLMGCGGEDDTDTDTMNAAETSDAVLVPPTQFTAAYDNGMVHTTWVPSSDSQDMFMVMRMEDGATPPLVTWKVPATATSYDDTTPESGKTYMYMVHAMLGQEVSEPSNKVMVSIP
jgi:hypothetical protein